MDDHVLDLEGARALCDLTTRLMVASDASEMAGTIADAAHGVAGAEYAQLGLWSSDGDCLVLYHGAALDPGAQEEWPVVPLDLDTPVGRVMKSGRHLAIQSADDLAAEYPVVRAATEASGYESLVVVPIFDPLQRDRCAGTLSMAWVERDRADGRAIEIMEDLAERCALALANVDRSAPEVAGASFDREVVLALQLSLLPSLTLDHPHLEIASRYVVSNDELVVGGDWYSSVPLPGGRVAIAIGDVAGHGYEAALAMGQIRHDFEALVAHHWDPNDLLEELDRYAEKRNALMTTVGIVCFDATRLSVVAAAAGHPPPILKRDDAAELLDHSLGPPVGTGLEGRGWSTEVSTVVSRGDIVVLYTDGLIERRGESIRDGIERLRELTESLTTTDVEQLCDDIVAACFADREPRDDVALLVARVR